MSIAQTPAYSRVVDRIPASARTAAQRSATCGQPTSCGVLGRTRLTPAALVWDAILVSSAAVGGRAAPGSWCGNPGVRLGFVRWTSAGAGSATLLLAVMASGCTATEGAQDAVPHGTSSPVAAAPTPAPSPPLAATPAPTPPLPRQRIIPIPPWRPNVPNASPPSPLPLQPSPAATPCGSPLTWPGACVVPVAPAR